MSDVAEIYNVPDPSPSTKYTLLTSHFKPPFDYQFPKNAADGRSFQSQWLTLFPWLVYSKLANGGFCLSCVLFARPGSGYHGSNPGVLVSRALTNFKKAMDTLKAHAQKSYHKAAIVQAEEFRKTMSGQQPDIQQRLSNALSDRIALNRQKLSSIMKTVLLCGRQNIVLRGHRDSLLDLERDVGQ